MRIGLPHSEICGSKGARPSPQLIAACYVLHRLCVPRHPPDALALTLDRSAIVPCPETRPAERPVKSETQIHAISLECRILDSPVVRTGEPAFTMSKSANAIACGRSCLIIFRRLSLSVIPRNGGARRDRTDDLMLAKHALSQLSYGPGCSSAKGSGGPGKT